MRIENGLVYSEDGTFQERTVRIRGERFSAFSDDQTRIDATNCYVLPGLIDLHVHGAMGGDFSDADPEALHRFASYEAAHGVTTICPTTMTLPKETLCAVADSLKTYREQASGWPEDARIAGFRMEGPFLSAEKCGSQETAHLIPPDAELVRELDRRSGKELKIIDVAPELPGAIDFIAAEKDDYCVSLAHTNADYTTARTAIQHGARHLTHMFNAMSPVTHRAPGVIGAASDDDTCEVELIADGVHVHPSMVRNSFRIFGSRRILLISDSMRATGMPDGAYELGGHEVTVRGKRATLPDGTIAASVTNLYDCMVTCVRDMGIPMEQVLPCVTMNPARCLHINDKVGSIALGKLADLLLVDRTTLHLRSVILRGTVLF